MLSESSVCVNEVSRGALYKEIRYFANSTHDADDAVKIITYYPNGKRFSEIDKLPEEQFTQHFFSDGTFADFTHWQPGKLIAGVAIDPKTGNETHFSEGAGCLTTYDVVHDSSETDCYQNGRPFLIVRYSKSRRYEITLYAGNDCLIVSKEVEVILLQAEHEKWTRKVGEGPQLQIGENQVVHGRFFSGPRSRWEALEAERKAKLEEDLKIWKPMYENRRPNFLKHYSEVLSTTDQSWESLHIEFIRDDAPWPEH